MGKKSSDAPEYPVELMQRQLDSSEAAADRYLGLSEQQQAWSQDMWDNQMFPLMQETTGAQTEVMREQLINARKDRDRYESKYQPLEDNLIEEFQNYDTDQRRNLESGRAMAQQQQTFDAQRGNAEQRLASYGVDPSQLRAGAIDSQARVKLAANQAAAGNQARTRVEDTGRALRAEAINIGRGMPSQVAQSYGQTLSAGNSANANMNSSVGQGANMMGTGASWGGMQGQATGQTASMANNMYSGQLAEYNAQPDPLGALGGMAGQAFGAWAGSGFAEGGGAVGGPALQGSDLSSTPGPNDAIPVTLAPNEYIIPADVAIVMGTEKLDGMVEKTRQKAGERGGANMNTPAGEMPNAETPIKGQTLAAEGGGAVGMIEPTNIAMQMPTNPGWGYNMGQGDPFAAYHEARAIDTAAQEQQAGVDMQAGITAGSAMRENYDEGKGLPGMFKDWQARRTQGAPTASAEGGGAVGMPGKPLAVY